MPQIFSAAAISLDDIFECVGHLIHEYEQYQLDDKKQRIVGKRRTTYGAIALKTQPLASIPADEFQACLKSLLTTEGLTILNWTPKCEDWLQRAEWLGGVMKNFPRVSKVSFIENIDQWLLPYISNVTSLAQLKRANIYELIVSSLTWDQQQLLDQEAPLTYVTPSDKKIPIVYDKNQGPTVSVRLQEMFGEVESPRIGGNQVPLRFELLSPAQRPIQTTSDLANFWLTSYFDVAKDMRGRYPRHRWPEQPLLEKAGHSIKHKRR